MKEEWLMSGAIVPVDVKTTAALVAEIKRLIDVVGGMALAQPEPVKFKCTVVDDQHPQGIPLEQWGDPPAAQPAPVQEPVAYCEIHYLPEPCAQCSKEHEGYNTPPAAQPAPVQEPIHQWRQRYSPYWYDGYPDHEDGGGPYETRILYATPPALTKENT
jgi:hypothetical protein